MCQFKKYIVDSGKTRKRKSDQLNPEATTPTNLDTINRLTAVFKDEDLGVQEENHIFPNDTPTMFDDAAEEVRVEAEKTKTRTGHRGKFPQDILDFGYKKWLYDLSFRQQQNRTNVVSKKNLASCVDRKELRDIGIDYIEKNLALALDVVTYINLLIFNLSSNFTYFNKDSAPAGPIISFVKYWVELPHRVGGLICPVKDTLIHCILCKELYA